MRAIIFVVLIVACERGAKHDDAMIVQAPVHADAAPKHGAKVAMSTPNGEASVDVEVVATEPKIERGLMFRQHLPPDEGMLFLMTVEKDWTFWMRNTLIPLDMIFIKRDMTIAGIVENAEPRTETMRQVGVPSVFVLEVNGGWTAAHHVVANAKVRFDGVAVREPPAKQ